MSRLNQSPDYLGVKEVDRRLSDPYIGKDTFFCDVGGCDGIDTLIWLTKGAKGICIDVSKRNLKPGNQAAKDQGFGHNVDFIVASATNIPLLSGVFDVVTSFSVIDHIPPKKQAYKAISEFTRIAKKRGHVVVTIPNKLFVIGTISMKLRMSLQKDAIFEQRFTPKELSTCCKKCNLQILKYDSKFPLHVDKAIMTWNVPEIVSQIMPLGLLNPTILLFTSIFRWIESNQYKLVGARYGFDAIKVG
jgi:ubiquinone/menaquinone biosynthesis C-methylase UbiE